MFFYTIEIKLNEKDAIADEYKPIKCSVHLYRNRVESVAFDVNLIKTPQDISTTEMEKCGNMLCVLAVPLWTSCQDFLKLMGNLRNQLSHLCLIQDSIKNRYMILLKFMDVNSAWNFYRDFNGRPFNSFEPEICHVVYLEAIQIHSNSVTNLDLSLPTIPLPNIEQLAIESSKSFIEKGPELPTCPVCLDRMDASVTGLLTTLCNHTFHCNCIIKWHDSTCPVCRYSTMDDSSTPELSNRCNDCQSCENLWICLICANVGCGRYALKHAHQHYLTSNHIYALELETQRVWDYEGDGYVHRLIQNKSDGKLVQLPPPTTSVSNRRPGLDTTGESPLVTQQDTIVAEKVEGLGMQYANLLQSQLSTQRHWYENQITKIDSIATDEISRLILENEKLNTTKSKLESHLNHLETVVKTNETTISKLEQKLEKYLGKFDKICTEISEERAINQNLLENQQFLKEKLQEKETELQKKDETISELSEQVRDLMFFLETQSKLGSNSEIQEASIVGVSASPSRTKKKKGKK